MSDIIKEINERIATAEGERDKAKEELAALKKKLSRNGIVFDTDGNAYVFAYAGARYNCHECVFMEYNSTMDDGKCRLKRDCNGKRAFSLSEIKQILKERNGNTNRADTYFKGFSHLVKALEDISESAREDLEDAKKIVESVKEEEG